MSDVGVIDQIAVPNLYTLKFFSQISIEGEVNQRLNWHSLSTIVFLANFLE